MNTELDWWLWVRYFERKYTERGSDCWFPAKEGTLTLWGHAAKVISPFWLLLFWVVCAPYLTHGHRLTQWSLFKPTHCPFTLHRPPVNFLTVLAYINRNRSSWLHSRWECTNMGLYFEYSHSNPHGHGVLRKPQHAGAAHTETEP